jgi:cell division protein FtsI (penicillin-binding protein 3)
MTGIVDTSVRFCFEFCARGTVAEGAVLEIERIPLRAHCSGCANSALRALQPRGIGFVTESQRVYPKQGLAGQVIGFVGTDDTGLEGIEYAYDSALAGHRVRVKLDHDARGRPVSLRPDTFPELPRGYDVVLTIDERIQFFAERELRAQVAKLGARGGIVVAMDPRTGEILALASGSAFNPNNFRGYPPDAWRERAVTDSFEPGSTLKAVLAAAILEERLVRPDDMFFGEHGSIQVAGVNIRDHEKFGWLTFREVLEKSSNVGAIKLGQRLGRERMHAYLQRFGFGEKTGIDLPGEAPGLLRPPQQWSEVSLASLSIGQEMAATPIQLVTAISAIANGGMLVRPRVVKHMLKGAEIVPAGPPTQGRRILSESAARQVTTMLQGAVAWGTGKGAAVDGYPVAGKTGTAQKYDASLGRYSSDKVVASFVGYLPADQPKVAIFVSLDEPRGEGGWGGVAAAPVFSAIAQQSMRYLRVPPQTKQTLPLDGPIGPRTRPRDGPPLVTISTGNFVEEVKESVLSSVDRMRVYLWDRFMTVDPKNARRPGKKSAKSEK